MSRGNCDSIHNCVWCRDKLIEMIESIPNWHTSEEREAMIGGVNAIDRVLLAVNLLQGDPRWKDAIHNMNETVEEVLHYDQSKCN